MMDRLSKRFMYYCGLLATHGVDLNDLKHIQNLIDAEEQGLLLLLPGKRWDKLFMIYKNEVVPVTIDRIIQNYHNREWTIVFNELYPNPFFDDIGKTVFRTKEEAERALQNMNRNDAYE